MTINELKKYKGQNVRITGRFISNGKKYGYFDLEGELVSCGWKSWGIRAKTPGTDPKVSRIDEFPVSGLDTFTLLSDNSI